MDQANSFKTKNPMKLIMRIIIAHRGEKSFRFVTESRGYRSDKARFGYNLGLILPFVRYCFFANPARHVKRKDSR